MTPITAAAEDGIDMIEQTLIPHTVEMVLTTKDGARASMKVSHLELGQYRASILEQTHEIVYRKLLRAKAAEALKSEEEKHQAKKRSSQ
jgi:hypothetical protein